MSNIPNQEIQLQECKEKCKSLKFTYRLLCGGKQTGFISYDTFES